MNNWKKLGEEFIKQKQFLGYKYKTELIVINSITSFLVSKNVTVITKEVTEQYVRLNKNLKDSTISRNMGVFREFCKYLKIQNINCYQIPVKLYSQKKEKYIPYIYSKNEIQSLIKAAYEISKDLPYSYRRYKTIPLIFKILYQTGMRIGEVLNLKIKDYLIKEECFYLKNTKNNQERLIFLPKSLNSEIFEYHSKFHYSNNSDDYFFKLREGKISMSSIERIFNKMLESINIKKNSKHRVHNLRHCFIIHYIEKTITEGQDINVIFPVLQVHLGHQSLKALEYYFKITKVKINEIGKMTEEKIGSLIPDLEEVEND